MPIQDWVLLPGPSDFFDFGNLTAAQYLAQRDVEVRGAGRKAGRGLGGAPACAAHGDEGAVRRQRLPWGAFCVGHCPFSNHLSPHTHNNTCIHMQGINWVEGRIADRVAQDGVLAAVNAQRPMFAQFPFECDVVGGITGRPQRVVVAHKVPAGSGWAGPDGVAGLGWHGRPGRGRAAGVCAGLVEPRGSGAVRFPPASALARPPTNPTQPARRGT